ncbi:hypothetical protein ACIPSE_10765 [Streptomyces sp. NPDC090106]|uniref:hypothetical protein n=1 Tax=Streptomyces sp. NPDC090106 TaxID=3365946 RepID=UPI003814DCDD
MTTPTADLPGRAAAAASSPLDAVPDMRATAKWMVAAWAGVGAVLLAGVPLTVMRSAASTGRLLGALAGLVVALTGVGWALWVTSEALMPRLVSYRELGSPRFAEIKAAVEAEPELFLGPSASGGATALGAFDTARTTHRQALRGITELLEAESDPTRRQALAAARRQAVSWVADDYARVSRLAALMYAWDVRAGVRRARVHTFVGCGLTLVGAFLLILATSSDAETADRTPAPAAVSSSAATPGR